jgi:hypothetical protein
MFRHLCDVSTFLVHYFVFVVFISSPVYTILPFRSVLCVRLRIDKMIYVSKPLYIAFLELEKVFENVEWNKVFSIMEKIEMDCNDRRII